jgi:hypothetical protein
MTTQNYAKHTQLVPLFHFILMPVLLLTLIGAAVNLYQSWDDHERIYSASLILVLVIGMIILSFLARTFALKAQDRAIRAEENLRCFVLTGKLLDPRLTIRQVIALRFAPDAELVTLAKRAADESLAADAVKRAIQQWRPDTYRV